MPLMVGAATPPPTAPNRSPLWRKRIAFTTPLTYARRLSHLLELRGSTPLSFPAVSVQPTPQTIASLRSYLQNPGDSCTTETLESFSALAFTSRNGISAFARALDEVHNPPLFESGELFTILALGKDAELLSEEGFISKICRNPCRIRVVVPVTASPEGLVESLGTGFGRRILCPVPIVIDLEEPPVIPDFIRDLKMRGWVPVRVPAYETRWAGRRCMEGLVGLYGSLDAIVFTSTAEVEGLLKGLQELGWDWARLRKRWPEMVVAAHGPVTAEGADRLGVRVDLVSSRFSSFYGVVDALASRLAPLG